MRTSASASAVSASGRALGHLRSWGVLALGLVLGVVLLGSARPAVAVPIRITYTDSANEGFNDPDLGSLRRRSFEAAAAVWSRRLAGSVPVLVEASFDPLGGSANSATLGQAGPAGLFANWNGNPPPLRGTYYAVALANNLAGGDLETAGQGASDNPNGADILATFNSDVDGPNVLGSYNFYYGLDGAPGDNSDFFAVVLHEMGHGLGFTGVFERGGTSQNIFTSFDRLIADGSGADASLLQDLTAEERSIAFRSGSLYFAGARARAAGGGRNAKLYGPVDFSSGSSIYHTDEDFYHGTEELMTPIATGSPHDAGPITFAMFLDIGWGSVGATSTPTPTPPPGPTATPVPAARPANDNFERAQGLAAASGSVRGTSVNATKQGGEPKHAGDVGGASVWYRWTAPSSGRVTFSTSGSSFDTLLAAYTGASVNALIALSQGPLGDDATETDKTSRITFDAIAGRVYYVAVDGYAGNSSASQGTVALSWTLAAAPSGPPNDNFERAQVLAGSTARVGGTTLGATLQLGEAAHGGAGRSVWFRWTAPSTRRWTFTTQGSAQDTTLDILLGTAVKGLRRIGIDDDDLPLRTSSVTLPIVVGTTIFIAVDSKSLAGGPFILSLGAAPANDDASGAQVLVGDSGSLRQDTSFASRQVGEPIHASNLGNRSVWFRWTPNASGLATLRTTGSSFDTLLAIYTGTPLAGLSRVAASDNDAGVLTSTVSFKAAPSTTYWIAVDGKNASAGALVLGWSLKRAPSNDLFARAQVLAGASGAITGTNANADIEVGEPRAAGVGAGRSVWFRWVAPQTGRATFVAYSSLFRPAVSAFEGATVSSLQGVSTVVSSDDLSTVVALDAVAGHTYWISVDSYNLGALTTSGGFSLRWSLSPTSARTALLERPAQRLAFWMP